MQTIWLQRSNPDIPWGFRLVGGREFGVPLSVQRVTPGSVAAAALGPGDVILKVGNVMATNLEHNDAQELVRQASNILQLTIKKAEGTSPAGPPSPAGPGYGSHMSAQLNDNSGYSTTPRGFGTGIPINTSYNRGNEAQNYATTPRNYGSQYQAPPNSTRIEIQRVNPTQQQSAYNNNYYNDSLDTGGSTFPDYTVAYRNQEPIHDSPGGPVNLRGYNPPSESTGYSSKSLPREEGGYNSYERDDFGGASGPPAYAPRSYNASQSSFSPRETSSDGRFNTGFPLQTTNQQKPPQPFQNQAKPSPSQPGYSPVSYTFSPSSSGPMSPRSQTSSTSGFISREQVTPPSSHYNQTPSYGSDSSGFDQSNVRSYGSNQYSAPQYAKQQPYTASSSFNAYNNAPQSVPGQKPYVPAQVRSSPTFEPPSAFSPSQPTSYQSPMSPGSSSGYSVPQSNRRVSFDQNVHENDPYIQHSGYPTTRSFRSPPPVSSSSPGSYDYGVTTFTPQPASFSRQSSRHDESYTASPYTSQSGPLSPRSEPSAYGYRGDRDGFDSSGVSEGIDNINLGSPSRYEPPPPVAPPPPPPPPPPGPPPPPAPPLTDWNSTPYKRQTSKQRDEAEEQKVPDQLLNTMLKSAKGGGPKPFSYGIDLSELKKKIGPPTAPKPRPGQPGYEEQDDEQETPRQYSGPPRRPAGQVQSDYFIKRDDDSESTTRSSKKPAGQVQSDYYQTRQMGPRSEIDESPININMGTNPKKQSKSFKVLQWMTETDKDEAEEPSQKPRRSRDPERRHNADDDEMRFSGLHSKADIPSKAFGVLQRISADGNIGTTQNGKETLNVGHEDESVGNYDETSIRYKGKHIPSPSFRVLQTWAQHDPDPNLHAGGLKDEEEDDGLPDTLNSEDMVDKRYKGGNIPSKVFKVLQKSVGDDTSEAASPSVGKTGGQPVQKAAAPISDF